MKKLKNNRALSFAIIIIVYALATVVGIFTYRALGTPWGLSLLIADTISPIAVFIFSLIFKNASVYDPYWSVQPPVILAAFFIGEKKTLFGLLLLVVVSLWAIRLTTNWAYTFANLNHQDWRYTMLKEKTGIFYPVINFIGIHMVPTLVVYACTMPAVYAIKAGLALNAGSCIFLCLSVFAFSMQGIADYQMHRFRKNKTSAFIRVGLWKYSRHPNYLGEILMWWGIGLAVICAAPEKYFLLAGAVANTLLFLVVSIPMADKRQSRKEGFDKYRQQTRMLLPVKKAINVQHIQQDQKSPSVASLNIPNDDPCVNNLDLQ